jgi:hypothetical protein
MAKVCPHCSQTSDADNICTWCNKSLVAPQQPAAAEPGAARPVAPAGGPSVPGPAVAASVQRKPPTVEQPRPLWPYYIGAAVAIILVVLVAHFIGLKAASGSPPEPADWTTMQSMTKLISIEVPGNYRFSTSGSSASYEQITVKATKLCRVYVDGNGTKGAMSDVAAATSRTMESEGSLSVAARGEGKFHAAQGELQKRRDPSYQEAGDMEAWSFAGMPAAYSEYTTVKKVGLFAVKMKGWRLSCMGGDFGYQVWAEAPQAQWEKFQPTASKILQSAKINAQN